MPLHGIDHVELWVGNAAQSAHFYKHAFGFREVAYAGLETGVRDRTSHVLQQGRMRLVLTGALSPASQIAAAPSPPRRRHPRHRAQRPRRAHAYAPRSSAARRACARRGRSPTSTAPSASPRSQAYGDTVHTFVERRDYSGPFLPGYEPARGTTADAGLLAIDHIVGNVELGAMNTG